MTQTITLQTIITPREALLASELSARELVMMNLDKGAYYGLEAVGKTIWDALDQPRTVNELCDVVLATYSDVDRPTVEADMFVFLDELLKEELVAINQPQTGEAIQS